MIHREHITWFSFEGEFAGDYPNCLDGGPALTTIEAMVPTRIIRVSGEQQCRPRDSCGSASFVEPTGTLSCRSFQLKPQLCYALPAIKKTIVANTPLIHHDKGLTLFDGNCMIANNIVSTFQKGKSG